MAEPFKRPKVSLREILDEIAADDAYSDTERAKAKSESLELEYREWCERQSKDVREK